MKIIKLENNNYHLIKDYKGAFNLSDVDHLYTDYFESYDYIIGDWSYGKLRLKGFCNKENKNFKKINDYSKVEEYIEKNCAYDCRYFILEKYNKSND